ncbi:MAG: DUF1987 domain-containing protein [Bacteroidales bacterium]|nr:DUF1987 domain-containing protein [Bacteroidales bacterium]
MEVITSKTDNSPLITLEDNTLRISGRSYMNNAGDFYHNIIDWLEFRQLNNLNVVVDLEYFNTSSSKSLLEFFRWMEKKAIDGKDMKVHWQVKPQFFEMYEAGEDYYDLLPNLDFEIVEM